MPGPHEEPRRGLEPRIPAVHQEEGGELVSALNLVLRNRMLLLAVPAAVGLLIAAFVFFQPRTYRSDGAFVPQQTQRTQSTFSGLAAQFGIALPSDALDQSPAFYADLVRSRAILREVAETEYEMPGTPAPGVTLVDVYEIDEDEPNVRLYEAIERLRRSIRVANDVETGVVTFSVATEHPALARAIGDEVIDRINAFNLTRRRSLAEAERAFVEERLDAATGELATAEMALRRFDEANLRIDNSPQLQLERDRLVRTVGMRQEVVTMLTQAYEQARIDEVRNTPAITVIERPSLPVKSERRGTLQYALLAFLVTAFVMAVFVLGREFYQRIQLGDSRAHEEFRGLRRSLRWLPGRGKR